MSKAKTNNTNIRGDNIEEQQRERERSPPIYLCVRRSRAEIFSEDDDLIVLENSKELSRVSKQVKTRSAFESLAEQFKNLSLDANTTENLEKKEPELPSDKKKTSFFNGNHNFDIKPTTKDKCYVLQKVTIQGRRDQLMKDLRTQKVEERRKMAMMRLKDHKINLLDPKSDLASEDFGVENFYELKLVSIEKIKNFEKRERVVIDDKDLHDFAEFLPNDEYYYESEDSENRENIYEEDMDSNDEDHPRNDYPDTPPEWKENSSADSSDIIIDNDSDSDDTEDGPMKEENSGFGFGEEGNYLKRLYANMERNGESGNNKMKMEDDYEIYNEHAFDPIYDVEQRKYY